MESDPEQLDKTATAPTERNERVAVSHHTTIAAGDVIDRYVVESELGAGGMGYVLKAYDPELERHVAIKLLKIKLIRDPEASRRLLLREGRAIGQLNHPNVVSIYDVGETGDDVYIIMELIDGASLGTWLRAESRDWSDVVDVFSQAGRGLAAAHAAGIIHRDFKPSNVLVGADGRVRVLDFGLARPFVAPDVDGASGAINTSLSRTLTQTGGTAGTPLYMSPEQHAGQKPDARSDVFSFCVALYESLAGHHPFGGDDLASLRANVLDGRMRTDKPIDGIPRKLDAVLRRGLSVEPAGRPSSMNELLAELNALRRPSWRVPALIAGGVAVGAVIAAVALGGGRGESGNGSAALCTSGRARVEVVWSDDAQTQVRSAFTATRAPFADASSGRAIDRLNEYASRWARVHDQACRDTHITGIQSDTMLDSRTWCLNRQLASLHSVVQLLSGKVDREVMATAGDTIARLPDPNECVDPLRFSGVRPPKPEQRAAVEALQRRLVAAQTLVWRGQAAEAIPLFETLRADAKRVGYAPLQARIALKLGKAQLELRKDPDKARAAFTEAASYAARAGMDFLVAQAHIEYAFIAGSREEDARRASELLALASSSVERAGSPPGVRAQFLNGQGIVAAQKGDYQPAIALFRQAVDLLEKDPSTLRQALRIRANIGAMLLRLGKFDKAIASHEALLPRMKKLSGPLHPAVANVYRQLALGYQWSGKLPEASRANNEALRIYRAVLGETHPSTTKAMETQGNLAKSAGEYARAERLLRRVLELRRAKLKPTDSLMVTVKHNLSIVLSKQKRYKEALALNKEAMDATVASVGVTHPRYAVLIAQRGNLLNETGKYEQALATHKKALVLGEKRLGKNHPNHAVALQGQVTALLRLERPLAAIALARRALALTKSRSPADYQTMRYYLGRALFESGRDKKGGRAMMIDAGNKLVAMGGAAAKLGEGILRELPK